MLDRVAEWIVDGSKDPPYCSACLTYALEDASGDFAMTKYCPECGAQMIGIMYAGRNAPLGGGERMLEYIGAKEGEWLDRVF